MLKIHKYTLQWIENGEHTSKTFEASNKDEAVTIASKIPPMGVPMQLIEIPSESEFENKRQCIKCKQEYQVMYKYYGFWHSCLNCYPSL